MSKVLIRITTTPRVLQEIEDGARLSNELASVLKRLKFTSCYVVFLEGVIPTQRHWDDLMIVEVFLPKSSRGRKQVRKRLERTLTIRRELIHAKEIFLQVKRVRLQSA